MWFFSSLAAPLLHNQIAAGITQKSPRCQCHGRWSIPVKKRIFLLVNTKRICPAFRATLFYVLIDWVAGRAKGWCIITQSQLISHLAQRNAVNKHFILWPLRDQNFELFFFPTKLGSTCQIFNNLHFFE